MLKSGGKIIFYIAILVLGLFICSCGKTDGQTENTGITGMSTEMAAETEDAEEEVLKLYREFIEREDLYALTATVQYPRGDSTAVYAFGDCTGDDIPELYIHGGNYYYIYTCRGGDVVLIQQYNDDEYNTVAWKNGAFMQGQRSYYRSAIMAERWSINMWNAVGCGTFLWQTDGL